MGFRALTCLQYSYPAYKSSRCRFAGDRARSPSTRIANSHENGKNPFSALVVQYTLAPRLTNNRHTNYSILRVPTFKQIKVSNLSKISKLRGTIGNTGRVERWFSTNLIPRVRKYCELLGIPFVEYFHKKTIRIINAVMFVSRGASVLILYKCSGDVFRCIY